MHMYMYVHVGVHIPYPRNGSHDPVFGMHEAGTCNPTSGFSQSVETIVLDPHVHTTHTHRLIYNAGGMCSWTVAIRTHAAAVCQYVRVHCTCTLLSGASTFVLL